MLGGAIEGTAGAALLPYVRVSGHASPRLAMAASMGLRHASRRFEVGLLYQLERYDDATKVHPGHMGMTTLGRERASNPFLAELAR